MKKYIVTVSGVAYDVTVEELTEGGTVAQAPKAAPAAPAAPKAAPAAPKAETPADGKAISAPMPGNILSVRVKAGDKVEKGAILCILEAMKMENEIMAPEAGVVKSVAVTKGAAVNTGDLLVTLA